MPPVPAFVLTNTQILALLVPYGAYPSSEQITKIRKYMELLIIWNQRFSLTSIKDHAELVSRHFGESMFLTTILPVENCRLADVGTGAGFPGLALKILVPTLQVTLIESNNKKSAFLAEVIRTLDLSDVVIAHSRYEELRLSVGIGVNAIQSSNLHIVTARAVGDLERLTTWAEGELSKDGRIALWLGEADIDMVVHLEGWRWDRPVLVPNSQRRYILVGRLGSRSP